MNIGKPFDRLHGLHFAVTRGAGAAAIALGCVWLAVGCGSREGENEANMTSYSTGENKNDTADLFTVPQDQMAHVQVVAVEK